MGKHLISIAAAALLFMVGAAPAVATAQSVMVLGVTSSAGDDVFTNNFTGALRNAASRVHGWDLNGREVSLAQMTLAHGCVEADVHCMAQIGSTLGVQLIVYGMVSRTSTSANHDYSVNLFLFDTAQGSITDQLTDTVPRIHSDIDDLRGRARRYIAQFSGAEQSGRMVIQTNLPDAQVLVDGQVSGSAIGGRFEAVVSVGQHEIEVRAEGHSTFRGSVSVTQDATTSLEVELTEGDEDQIIVAAVPDTVPQDQPEEPSDGPNIGAIVSFSLAGVGVVMTAVSWAMINSTNSDLEPYREMVGGELLAGGVAPADVGNTNACDYMKANNTGNRWDDGINLCSQGDTWFAVQIASLVTVGAGLASGLLFLLLDGDDEEESSTDNDIAIIPSFSPNSGFLSAVGTF